MKFSFKNIIIIFVINFISFTIKAQEQFQVQLQRKFAELPISVVSDENGNYIIASQITDYIGQKQITWLLKISKEGSLLKEKIYDKDRDNCVTKLLKINNNEFISLGIYKSDTSVYFDYWIQSFDTELNINWEKKHYTRCYKAARESAIINSDNEIITTGHNWFQNTNKGVAFVYKISISGELLDTSYITGGLPYTFDVLEKTNKTGYYLFALGTKYYTNDASQLIEVNNNLDFESVKKISESLNNANSALWLSDTTFIVTGDKWNQITNKHDVGIAISDTIGHVLYSKMLSIGTQEERMGFFKNLDYKFKDKIYFVSTTNINIASWPFGQTTPSQIWVNCFNDTLGLNWQQLIGGDFYYAAQTVLATDDGGCLVLGTKYDYNQNYDYDMFITKFDQYGNYTSNIVEMPNLSNTITLYPNPCNTTFTIKLPDSYSSGQIWVYNIFGKQVLMETINSNKQTINVENLSNGIYVYKYIVDNKEMETGKFVKQ